MDNKVTLTLDLDGKSVTLVLRRATARVGMQRARMINDAREVNKNETDEDMRVLRQIALPDLVSGTESVDGIPWPLTADQLANLPDEFVETWSAAVYTLNPHWLKKYVEATENQKKA